MFTRQHCYPSVNSVTIENGQCQFCYLHIFSNFTVEIMAINLILRICISGTFCFHCIRFCRSGIKICNVLGVVLKLYIHVHQLIEWKVQWCRKRFHRITWTVSSTSWCLLFLTHWGRVTHICVSKNATIGLKIMACRLFGAKPLSESNQCASVVD